jgi:hypothetical protein
MAKSIIEGPVWTPVTPTNSPTGSVVKNGEPGYQKRTNSPRAVDEVTYVNNSRLPKAKK